MIARTMYRYPVQDSEQDWPPLPERELRPLHRAVLAALGPLEGQRLLDVGCGVGLFLCAAERQGALVAGTDTAVERLEIARWALPDADLRVGGLAGPGETLPYDSGTFDVATMGASAYDGTDRTAVLAELVRVVRPGGRVAVGGWVRPAGCWAEGFAARLRGLDVLSPATGTDDGFDGALLAAGLTVSRRGEVHCRTTYPSIGAAWTAMLGSEPILRAIRQAGEASLRTAFTESVAGVVSPDGVVHLPKVFRYVVAVAPMSTMWALGGEPDNE